MKKLDLTARPVCAGPECDFAAKELAAYFERICGRRPEIAAACGGPCVRLSVAGTPEEAHARRNREDFRIFADGEDLRIVGEGPRGVIYGVYTLLEEVFGCRFFAEGCERVPSRERLEIPGDLRIEKHPLFQYRDCYISCMSPACKIKNKVNASLPADAPGGRFTYAGGFCHTIGALAEVELKTGEQPCLTDERVYETVLKNCRKWLRENPDAAVISITQNDSAPEHRGCQCARCRAVDEAEGSPSGSMIAFVNRVAEALEPEFPDVLVDTFAYRYTRRPPKTLRARHNVVVRFCTIESCFSHPIKECPEAAEDVLSRKTLAEDLIEWREHADHLSVWDYCTNFSRYLQPFPDLRVLRPNMAFFLENKAIGVFEEGDYQNKVSGEFNDLRAYLLCKLLWEPDMDEQTLRRHAQEFMEAFYGPAAEPMTAYIRSLHDRGAKNHFGIYSNAYRTFGCDPEDPGSVADYRRWYRELEGYFEKAEALADTETIRRRVAQAKLGLHAISLNSPGVLNDLPDEKAGRREFFDRMDAFGVEFYREGRNLEYLRDELKQLGY